ncbi:hypothetical protein BgAZ_107620 [Babesia gibsoni]|uniref:Mitotic-spindle organizing protein 1 n=1 Tax=Babesia gibsoni TaxID=33632 RepID=A0AAD8PGD9_BABGI|nr:hypothetical protein BgAZ_107620 [Babesia gibsoni]
MVSTYGSQDASFSARGESASVSDYGIKGESLDIIYEISQVLNTGLDRQTLAILVDLCEKGIDPSVLAYVVKHLKEARRKFLANISASKTRRT